MYVVILSIFLGLPLVLYAGDDGVNHEKREANARSMGEGLGTVTSVSCQQRGIQCAAEPNTSCAVVVKDLGVLIMNCSNEGCELVASK